MPQSGIRTMDARVVDAALREHLWPPLKARGFTRRAGRTGWRDADGAVHCLKVQSYNAYLAERMGATTYSFGINVGVFFPAIASRSAMGAFVRDALRPKESQCHLRRFLTKGIEQPSLTDHGSPSDGGRSKWAMPWADRLDVWLVNPDGSNVDDVARDAAEQVLADGLSWLDHASEPREAIRILTEEREPSATRGIVLGIYGGALGSPRRLHSIGALAAAIGDQPLLERTVAAMSGQAFWVNHPTDLDALRSELRSDAGGG